MLRAINALLLVLALAGAWFAIRAGVDHQRLRAAHRLLKAEVGLLRVGDPDKVHFVAIETGEPLHFAWQMYVPAKFNQQWRVELGSGGASSHMDSSSSEPKFDIVRVRIREEPKGKATVWVKHRGGSSFMSLGTKQLDALKSSQVPVEQLGAKDVAVVDRDQVATLLRIAEPDVEAKPLIEMRFGSRQAFQNQPTP